MTISPFIKVDKATFYRFIANVPDNERYAYVRGRIVQQQQGGTRRHGTIAGNLADALRRHFDKANGIVTEGHGVETAETIRFGDVVVEPVAGDPASIATTDPALVVEILSPSSGDRGLNEKPEEYLSLPSLQVHIVAAQTEVARLVWLRPPMGGSRLSRCRYGGQKSRLRSQASASGCLWPGSIEAPDFDVSWVD